MLLDNFKQLRSIVSLNAARTARLSPDFNYTRAGVSSTVNKGMVITVPDNTPRINDRNGRAGIVLAKNRYNYAAAFFENPYGRRTSAGIAINTATQPGYMGRPDLMTLTKAGAGSVGRYVDWNNGPASSSLHCHSVFVKKLAQVPCQFYLQTFCNGIGQSSMIAINFEDKVDRVHVAAPGFVSGVDVYPDQWFRLWTAHPAPVAGADFYGRIGFFDSANVGQEVITSLDSQSVVVSGFTLENGSHPAPYYPDSGSTPVVVGSDLLVKNNIPPFSEFTVALSIDCEDPAGFVLRISKQGDASSNIDITAVDKVVNGYSYSLLVKAASGNTELTGRITSNYGPKRIKLVYTHSTDPAKRRLITNLGEAETTGVFNQQGLNFDTVTLPAEVGSHKLEKLYIWPATFTLQQQRAMLAALD